MRSLLVVLLLSLAFCSSAFATEVRLSVAASMTDAIKEIVTVYAKKGEDATVLPNFASSGALAKQIVQGAPADIYISANPKWMNYLVENNRVPGKGVGTLAYNTLVFVGPQDLPVSSLKDIATLQRIAIGSPKSVPAGQYAEQALGRAGLLGQIQPKLILAKDVRQALMYADRGEVDGAFVYRTDALLAKRAAILLEVPQRLYDEVTYPIALTTDGAQNPSAIAFFNFLKSGEAAGLLKKHGFVVR
ncbi:MAG: molybdate ABC transporter substrate-binding protein [Syntrophotalea acetylenica]|jgi:molybdate transport system substrate-binding protein|uniref:Molybdate ABC transporter substrate-binding protein n=1 Tax=Syntrophotalea acetylenica TaxID=29542 RepID=A0A1L3GDU0_SYNAC|nr:molybdate ABC transporter substrate-binding protein [Syntrophotalea acetylenica]APG24121.1 molybdate ABC transporter substrate-binding protein [Syntrophotalea acetylenica]APG44703.1 molybdate ABC transporter substrate-binding protein [Syntrophotalea acetylenica]MDD4456199.1 molybdate ABC transporter substrate-binding protein [Syntrophotalea acetylenica]MDY0262868.1 molybdate ABC transporter substrate-binding protein [Syntrophotalea acetylenica]